MSDFDQERIDAAARWGATAIREGRCARINLSPGDRTTYRILVAAPYREYQPEGAKLGHYWWVALMDTLGRGYWWDRQYVHPSYATEKWTGGRDEHTGEVMAAFLNALAAELDGQAWQ